MKGNIKITSLEIQAAIYQLRIRNGHAEIMPNFTPYNWFECDVLSFTSAGYMHEYEIKVSRSDFKADFKKETRIRNPKWARGSSEEPLFLDKRKHHLLEARCLDSPNYFWFVTPENLLDIGDIPEYAGWMEVYPSLRGGTVTQILRPAPKLHSTKPSSKIRDRIKENSFYRYQQAYFIDNCKRNRITL